MGWQIAIDGPAGSGKSTIAKALASKLNFEYLDTGAMYRAVTLKALNLNINLENETEYDFLETTTIDFVNGKIFLDGVDVSNEIRTVEVTNNVSLVSKFKYVRDKMVSLQQKLAGCKNIILDGRDIGTVVLKKANLKIYLYATSTVRAQRRLKERAENGIILSLEEQIKEIETRDYKDSTREISPLTQADDAVFIDTSLLNVETVIDEITRLVLKRGYSMEELEMNVNVEEVKEDQEDLNEEAVSYKEMQIVHGTVVEVQEAREAKGKDAKPREERVLIELENGEKGFLFKKDCAGMEKDEELFDKFEEGDEVTVAIKKIFPDGGYPLLSTILVEKYEKLKAFEETVKERPIIKAKVIKKVGDFGLLMKYEDFTCLLPSNLATFAKEEFDAQVGKELEVVPIRIDLTRIRIIVSEQHAIAKKEKAEKKEFISKLEVGQVYEGTVKNIESYGAFVELYKGVEGLLHISEFDHNRISKPEKVLSSGDTVKVQVIKIEKEHIGLSRKALLPNHWENYFGDKQIGDVVTCEAIEVKPIGIRVLVSEELEGFIPKSEYSWDREAKIEEEVKLGDKLQAKLIEADKTKRRIILSTKQLSVNPWDEAVVNVNDIITVKVDSIQENGFKVVYQGISGFMSKGAVKASEVNTIEVGTECSVKVKAFDALKQKFVVSKKDAEEKVEKENFNKFKSTEKMTNTFGEIFESIKK